MPELQSDGLVMIGGGGHCRSVLDALLGMGEYRNVVITDNSLPIGSKVKGCKVVGNDEMLASLYLDGYRNAFICVGSIKDTSIRRRIKNYAEKIGFSFVNIIDGSVSLADDIEIGEGVFVGKHAIVNSGCIIQDYSIINSGAIIEHDCKVGEFSHISVGTVVCGGCQIANDVFVGANSTLIQEIKIGSNSVIGAGSVVLKDVPNNTVVTGVWK